jgi:hypothetical protein
MYIKNSIYDNSSLIGPVIVVELGKVTELTLGYIAKLSESIYRPNLGIGVKLKNKGINVV